MNWGERKFWVEFYEGERKGGRGERLNLKKCF